MKTPVVEKKRDWVPICVSLASLCISLLTAANSLLPRDDIRIMIDNPPAAFFDDKGATISIHGRPQLSFINSGNRAASISHFVLSSQQLPASAPVQSDCLGQNNYPPGKIALDNEPFVLNPGEIKVVEAMISKDQPLMGVTAQGRDGNLHIASYNLKNGDQLLICFELALATPDSYVRTWKTLAYAVKFDENFGRFTPLFEPSKPLIIEKKGWPSFSFLQ